MGDISVYSLNHNMRTRINNMNSAVQISMDKISSGKAIYDMQELAKVGKAELLLGIEGDLSKTISYKQTCEDADRQIRFTEGKLKSLIEIAADFKEKLASLQSSSGKDMNFKTIAEATLRNIEVNLNSNFEGKYIFSGSNIYQKSVSDIVHNSNILADEISNNYYNGSSEKASVLISDDFRITFGINADEEAFQNLIASVHKALEAYNENEVIFDKEIIIEASEYVDSSLKQINQLISKLGNHHGTISSKINELSSFERYLVDLAGGITDTDIPTETSILSQHVTVLQAAFMVYGKVSKTNLVDYL